MFIGHFPAGGEAFIPLVTTNSSQVVANADSSPTYRIYDSQGNLVNNGTGTFTRMDSGNTTGLYYATKSLESGDGYMAGELYTVLVSYAITSSFAKTLTFRVI